MRLPPMDFWPRSQAHTLYIDSRPCPFLLKISRSYPLSSKPFAALALPLLFLVLMSGSIRLAEAGHDANGQFKDLSVISSQPSFNNDGNVVIDQTNTRFIDGTLTGSYVTVVHLTLYSGFATYTAIDTCTCTVAEKSGTLVFVERGYLLLVNGVFTLASHAKLVEGSGQLDSLKATIRLEGVVYDPSGLTVGTYSGMVSSS